MLYTVHICTYIWVTSTHVLKWWEFLQSSDFKFLPLLILKPFNSQHQSRHFQLQLLCISIFVLTLCPPNSQFGHFHLLHFVTLWRYEVRFQGQDQTALDKWLLLEVGWNAFLQPEERRLWKELCRPFRLDYDFLFFFPPCHLCLLWVILQRHWEVHQRVSPFPPSLEGGSFSGCLQELGSLVFAVESQGVESQLITKCSRGFNQWIHTNG